MPYCVMEIKIGEKIDQSKNYKGKMALVQL